MAQDFKTIYEELAQKNLADKENISNCGSLFSTKWPDIAEKIILLGKKKKGSDVKSFLVTHEKLIESGINCGINIIII